VVSKRWGVDFWPKVGIVAWGNAPGLQGRNGALAESHAHRPYPVRLNMAFGQSDLIGGGSWGEATLGPGYGV
jgi:hypothetical protein